MGISGLLPLLKSIQKPCNLQKFAGQTIGVDAYGWLHRGTIACAIDLALGKATTKYVDFSMHRVRMLIHFGIIPYMVFDGDYLPSKAVTEVERAKKREESKRRGLELYHLNKPSQAHLELQKAVDVTPEMARQLIDELKKIDVRYVVAPYEADAQLAYLERRGIIQGMISEDSDLLVFGAKRLLTKLDQYGGCVEINRADFTACREISLVGWSDAEFRRMAILSGCDYLASINRMGLKSAYRYVRKYKTIEKILQMLAFDGQYHIPTGYLEKFYRAELTFLHQRVFDPSKNDVVMMTDPASGMQLDDLSFVGADIEHEVAIGVARGDLDPMTKQPIRVKNVVKLYPQTPWGNPRRNTVNDSSDTKATKSIDSFFRVKRTPLAELDPNSFTPSPTQERLLQRATTSSWDSSPAPVAPPSPQSSALMPLYSNDHRMRATTAQSRASRGANSSHMTSLKRRRLCLEPKDENSEVSNPKSSPFFSNSTRKPNSPTDNSKKNKKGKEVDITIWSDDSVEDAMFELSDVMNDPNPAETRKLDVFRDSDQAKQKMDVRNEMQGNIEPDEESQLSTASRGTGSSELTISTPASSVASSTPLVTETLDKHVTAELKALAASYTYQPETEAVLSQPQAIKNTDHHALPSAITQCSSKPQLRQHRNMTPLQRLGMGALSRTKSCDGLPQNLENAPEKAGRNANLVGIRNHERKSSHQPTVNGSEDAIVPDSEDSADDVLSEEEGKRSLKIDLGRFAFAA